LAFLFEKINELKRRLKPEKTARNKKRKTQSNLTTSSDEDEDYFFKSSKAFSASKTKPTKSSHPTSELVVSQYYMRKIRGL
jgi:hypothetical protein